MSNKIVNFVCPDTLLYLVNLKEGGFAILAGQTKLTSPVFCITDEGALSSNQMEEALNKLDEDLSTKAVPNLI